MIISQHAPKAAGSSFKKSLKEHFKDKLLSDYQNPMMCSPAYTRGKFALEASLKIAKQPPSGIECVHGHFLAIKYLLLSTQQPLKFITWMRNPVDRMISHYYFWQSSYNPETSAPHHKKVIEEGWTLEQFCLSAQFRNLYSQYFWGFPMEYFDFIGITEFYDEDLEYFSNQYLSKRLTPHTTNVTTNKPRRECINPRLIIKIKEFHKNDIELYQKALAIRSARMAR